MKYVRRLICFALLSSLLDITALVPATEQSPTRPFPETGKTVSGRFLDYWISHGGLPQQGYPISEEMQEKSDTDGKTYTVQYFERAVFEMHPENKAPNDVLLSLLGNFLYQQKYPSGAPGQHASTQGPRKFSETGHSVGGKFLQYWQTNGGLAQQGYPISDEFQEKSNLDGKTYKVQYFERAVFELHPENAPPYDVLLSQLGTFRYRAKYTQAAGGTLIAAAPMGIARSCHTATLLQNGKVLIAGGMIREGSFTASAELYDPSGGSFTTAGSMNVARACHTATLLQNGKVLLIGGSYRGSMNDAELYDPATGIFTKTGSMAARRDGFTATLLPNGTVLVTGGYVILSTGSYGDGMLANAELYDPATGTFSPAGNMTEPRAIHTATLLANGRVLLAGGGEEGHTLSSAEIYDPVSGRFSKTGSMTFPRYKHAASTLPDGKVLIVGGSDDRDWQGRYTSTELYNPSTGTFTSGGSMAISRFKLSTGVAILQNDSLLVVGGGERAEVYNPSTDRFFTVGGVLDAARFYQTATTLPDGEVLITGGYDTGITATSRTWLYRP
jgi:hypothetical protein